MKKRTILWGILTLLITAFIFSNSLRPGEDSSDQSMWVLELIFRLFPGLKALPLDTVHYVVRKLAHFTEFAALGFFAGGTMRSLTNVKRGLLPAVLYLAAVPALDETLQRFTPDRGPSAADALLDFSGAITGLAILLLLWQLVILIERKRKKT